MKALSLKQFGRAILFGLTLVGFLIASQCFIQNRGVVSHPSLVSDSHHLVSHQVSAVASEGQGVPDTVMLCCLDLKLVFKWIADWAPLVFLVVLLVWSRFVVINKQPHFSLPSLRFFPADFHSLVSQKVLLLC